MDQSFDRKLFSKNFAVVAIALQIEDHRTLPCGLVRRENLSLVKGSWSCASRTLRLRGSIPTYYLAKGRYVDYKASWNRRVTMKSPLSSADLGR